MSPVVRPISAVCVVVVAGVCAPYAADAGFNAADAIVVACPFALLAALFGRRAQTPAGEAASPSACASPSAESPAGLITRRQIMPAEKPTVTAEVARGVLHYFGDSNLGRDEGSFFNRLLALFTAADTENRERLRALYPEHLHAWEMVLREGWGLEWLRGIAKAEMDHAESGLDFAAVAS
jgi:hypothetical protein